MSEIDGALVPRGIRRPQGHSLFGFAHARFPRVFLFSLILILMMMMMMMMMLMMMIMMMMMTIVMIMMVADKAFSYQFMITLFVIS